MGINLHRDIINQNHAYWNRKPLLQMVYNDFYRLIAENLSQLPDKRIVELGSGLGNIHSVIPDCIRTDLFLYPWIDQIENAYQLSFENESISDLILTDVFHHLRYPGTGLIEFHRVLRPGGHVIMLEPCLSFLGGVVYGMFHREPVALTRKIEWLAPRRWTPDQIDYYAAQGNGTRIFVRKGYAELLTSWKEIKTIRMSAIAYAASGGYSVSQLYPTMLLPWLKKLERILNHFPGVFATRLLVILKK